MNMMSNYRRSSRTNCTSEVGRGAGGHRRDLGGPGLEIAQSERHHGATGGNTPGPHFRTRDGALVFMALAVVLLSAIFGYVAYMLLVGESSEHEMGFLQSLGLSRIQLLGLLIFEHLTVVALGLGAAPWAGFQMSRPHGHAAGVSDIGQSIVPRSFWVTDWSLMLPTYAMILAIFMTVMARPIPGQ